MSYALLWVIPRLLYFKCQRFGALCLFHLYRQVGMKYEMEQCSETLPFKLQTPVNYAEESV
jgi:hypothetical protein